MNSNKTSYLNEIIKSLQNLDGAASLNEIQNDILQRNTMPYLQTNANWRDNVRAVIQRHCSATKSYQGADDIFYSVYGLGEGYWGLKEFIPKINAAEINPIEKRIVENIKQREDLSTTERKSLVLARRGQGLFRDKIIHKYQKCIVTGIDDPRLLVASHVKPWRTADNAERLSTENGLLLSPLFDKMFDIGLITFSKEGRLVVSASVSSNIKSKLYVDFDKVYIPSPSKELKHNLEYHSDMIFIH